MAAEINENDDVGYKPGLFADAGAFEQFETVSATEEAVNGIFGVFMLVAGLIIDICKTKKEKAGDYEMVDVDL